MRRNDRIARLQGNRNPFIDDPGLLSRAAAAIRDARVADPALRARIAAALGAAADGPHGLPGAPLLPAR